MYVVALSFSLEEELEVLEMAVTPETMEMLKTMEML